MIWRNIFSVVRVNFSFYHTVHSVEILEFFPHNFFCKTSVKLTFSLKIKTVYRFDEKIFKWGKISEISTLSNVKKQEILSHCKYFSWNQLFSNFFCKTVAFAKFSPKKVSEREFRSFPQSRENGENNELLMSKAFSRKMYSEKVWTTKMLGLAPKY